MGKPHLNLLNTGFFVLHITPQVFLTINIVKNSVLTIKTAGLINQLIQNNTENNMVIVKGAHHRLSTLIFIGAHYSSRKLIIIYCLILGCKIVIHCKIICIFSNVNVAIYKGQKHNNDVILLS